jgi:hypothetical protein
MSLNSSFAQGRFSLAGEIGLITGEALCYGSSRHQLEKFLGMCFKVCRINGPRLGMDQ